MDVLSYESCFSTIANELNNMPLCLSTSFKDFPELEIVTANRLILGRNNRRALSGPCTVDSPGKMLEAIEGVFQAWWSAWNNFKLSEFVVKPPKWFKSSPNLKTGDIVVFQKTASEFQLGQTSWSLGRVIEAIPSKTDGRVRQVKLEYSNASEWRDGKKPQSPLRTTNRAARSVAKLYSEDEVDLMQNLASAAREAAKKKAGPSMGDGELAPVLVPEVRANIANYLDVCHSFSGECAFLHENGSVCKILRIHEDPWP